MLANPLGLVTAYAHRGPVSSKQDMLQPWWVQNTISPQRVHQLAFLQANNAPVLMNSVVSLDENMLARYAHIAAHADLQFAYQIKRRGFV